MNKLFINNIGDLAEAQRASFYRFLSVGIGEELINFNNPFFTRAKVFTRKRRIPCLVYLYPNEIKLKGPYSTLIDCLKRDISYTIQLYIHIQYFYSLDTSFLKEFAKIKETSKIKQNETKKLFLLKKFKPKKKEDIIKQTRVKQDLFFGEIPLMTEEGTFIINGCERVVISQIIRSPGIYFRKELIGASGKKMSYTATVISNKGLWTKFFLDTFVYKKSDREYDNLENNLPDKKNQLPVDRIYIKLNEFRKQTNDSIEGLTRYDKESSNKDKLFIYDLLKYFGMTIQEILDSLKYREYLAINQIKNRNLESEEIEFLIEKYFFNERSGGFSIGEIGRYKINKKLGLNIPKDITYLTAHDILGIIDGLIELKYYQGLNDDIDDIKNKLIRSVGELLQSQIRIAFYRLQKISSDDFLGFNPKKASLEFENSQDLDQWMVDPRPLTNVLKDFFKTSQLSQFMDQTNPLSELTHKRRISVFGPNGLKRDHISTVIRDIHPSQYGRLCPIETPEGQNAGLISAISMFGRVSSLGTIETPYFLMEKGEIFLTKRPIFLNPEQESNTEIAFCDVSLNKSKKIEKKYLSVKENSSFSIKKTEEINFITTSPLQIISLGTALIPFLEHDDANRALMGSNMQRQAVPLLYPQKALVGTGFESISILDSGMVIKSYSEGNVEFSGSNFIKIKDQNQQIITYFLKKFFRSNQETCLNQRPIVWKNEKVFSGQIIADGASTVDGELALGKNLLIAYMPWEGYNYEDAIIINEQLVIEDSLTSIHIEEYETNLTYCFNGDEKLTSKLPHLSKHTCRNLKNDGIIRLGAYVKENDILVGKLTPCEDDSTPEQRLLNTLYKIKETPRYTDTSLRVPQGSEGRVIAVRMISTVLINRNEPSLSTSSEIIKIYVAQVRKIQIGDKLAGRHGNKGIISRILPKIDMPYLPDGRAIDIIFNPLGVPSRMNVGQVFECLLGLAAEKLGNRFFITPFDEIYGTEASRILVNQKLKEASLKTNQNWLFNSYYPAKILLRDGRTGEFFDNPITVGKSYILKLIHLVEDKIHARSTGPYAMITEQPLSGKAQKGGQRFGEMEVWALEAYGCSNTLQELLTIKSDDIDGRNDMYEAILLNEEMEKPSPGIPEAFLTLIRELNSLGLDFGINKIDNIFLSTNKIKTFEKDLFKDLEGRLKLRALLSSQKAERFSTNSTNLKTEIIKNNQISEQNNILNEIKKKKKISSNL